MEITTPGPALQPDYLSALLSSIEESVVATDEQFIIQYWNKGAEQIFGYSANETLGRRGAEIMKFEYPTVTEAEARAVLLAKGNWKGKLRFTTNEGRIILLDVSVSRRQCHPKTACAL